MIKQSKDHLHSTGETYGGHMVFAISYGLKCIAAGVMAILHGLIPCIFEHSASKMVDNLANIKRIPASKSGDF